MIPEGNSGSIGRSKKDKVISCAECRRLKLKCDRTFPCSSCRKRGLSALCPNASLPTRPRKQTVDPARSNTTLTEMTGRIRELEDALRTLSAVYSSQPHPALTHSAVSGPPMAVANPARPDSPAEDEIDFLEESLGTLTIDIESGNSSFFGQSAGMESLYHNDLREDDSFSSSFHPGWSSGAFDPLRDENLDPLYPKNSTEVILEQLEDHLPDPRRAWALCDLYFNNAAWLYSAIPRCQFEEEILLPVYTPAEPSLANTSLTPSDASIMFMVFAIGSLLDPAHPGEAGEHVPISLDSSLGTFPSGNDEDGDVAHSMGSDAERYHQMARTAMTAGSSVMEEPTITGVRSIFLMAFYHMLLDRKETPQRVWSLTSIAAGLANSIGLHRDSGRWKLDPQTVEQRRALFWELYFFISLQGTSAASELDTVLLTDITSAGLSFGRPPQITLAFVDCELGADPDRRVGPDGEVEHGYRYRIKLIASTIFSEIRDVVLSTKPPKYDDVLAIDHKLRDSGVPLFGGPVGGRKVGPDVLKGATSAATMQRFFLLALKETLVMYLHRKYFVRACTSRSEDLPNCKYCPSLLAAFRSAEVIILLMGSLLVLEPELPRRFWFFWNHALASAIMVGSVAIRHPRSVLAVDAMRSLEAVLDQLQHWAHPGDRLDRPTKALKFVTQLRDRARRAMAQPDTAEQTSAGQPDELSILGGHARVFATKPPPETSSHSGSSGKFSPSAHIHPSLMEDVNAMNAQNRDQYMTQAGGYPSGNGPLDTAHSTPENIRPGLIGQQQSYVPSMYPAAPPGSHSDFLNLPGEFETNMMAMYGFNMFSSDPYNQT